MKSFIRSLLSLFLLLTVASAFTTTPSSFAGLSTTNARNDVSLNMVFGNKKSAAQKAEEEAKAAKFWQGEWVCKDCGYIYNRVSYIYIRMHAHLKNCKMKVLHD